MSIVKLNNRAVRSATAVGTTTQFGSMVLIKKLTASSSATLSFVNGSSDVVLDNTYKEYLFIWNSIHPASDGENFTVGFRDGSTDYDATKTTSVFRAYHTEDNSGTGLGYRTSEDIAQGTGFQIINFEVDNDADSCCCGTLHLFNPSSTTFVKHFISRGQTVQTASTSREDYVAGYCNVTAAIDAVQFKMSSGNIDAGTITLYGIN
jgi:hypothetical protein